MKHISATSIILPAKAQNCDEVSLFTPNKDLADLWCITRELADVAYQLGIVKLAR